MSAIDGVFTVGDVVISALRKAGIIGLGMTPYPSGADVLDAQNDLSDMLAQWNTETWLIWHKIDIGFVSDGRHEGAGGPYLVGPTGDFALNPRPDRIEAAYLRILANASIVGSAQPVDTPLRQIPSREDYANIALKRLVAFPRAYFYDSAMPNGNLFVYPWPQTAIYEIHIVCKDVFPLLLPMNLDLSMLPPNCRAAIKFNLAVRLRQAYGKGLGPDAGLDKLARAALWKLRQSAVQVPELNMPSAVMGRGARYNIYGDVYY